jgi:hypothetical protein
MTKRLANSLCYAFEHLVDEKDASIKVSFREKELEIFSTTKKFGSQLIIDREKNPSLFGPNIKVPSEFYIDPKSFVSTIMRLRAFDSFTMDVIEVIPTTRTLIVTAEGNAKYYRIPILARPAEKA